MFKLKKDSPEFECVDGPLTGRKFRRGETYAEIPQQDAARFEEVAQEGQADHGSPSPGPSPTGGEGQADKDKYMGGKKK